MALWLTTTRRDRQRAVALGELVFPGRLSAVSARTLFPVTTGSEVILRLRDDPDAVVRVRMEQGRLGEGELRAAVTLAVTQAEAWRHLKSAYSAAGYEIYALTRYVDTPWVAAEVTAETVEAVLAGLAKCSRDTGVEAVHILPPDAVRQLPPPQRDIPTLLRLTDRRRLSALSAQRTYHRVSYDTHPPALSLVRPFDQRQLFDATLTTAAGEWLAHHLPGAEVTAVMNVSRLLPAHLDRLTGYVIYRDAPDASRVPLGNHALLVTTDLAGALVTEPTVLRNIREGRGALRLPPL